MASVDITLCENDIPGSSLDGRNPSQLKNDELRFWLKCRGDNGKGLHTKAQLVKRVDEYISQGRDAQLVDPDKNNLYTRRKLAKQNIAVVVAQGTSVSKLVKYPENGWSNSLEKMPLFTKAEMNRHIENSGKRLGSGEHHSVPTSWRKAKTFLEDEYLKSIESTKDEFFFYFRCKCYHSYKKNEDPHSLKLALCIVSGEVSESKCTCVAGKTGYCNHSLALMLKVCKYSLFECKNTQELSRDCDQNPQMACTSQLQTWHRKVRGETIFPQPIMDIIIKKTRLDDNEHESGVKCLLYDARNNVQVYENEENEFKQTIKAINKKMGLGTISSNHIAMVDTKYGKSPVGSISSYQLSHTESNFEVFLNINCIARNDHSMPHDILTYPRFPLQDLGECQEQDLNDKKKELIENLNVSEDEINNIEGATRSQVNCELWKQQRTYRFTASNFHLITHRKRNHDTFANRLMHPKPFTSKHVSHGIKYEPVAIHEYIRYMNSTKRPVQVYNSGLVVYKKEPILGCTPDGKVVDPGCSQPFGVIEVKCPETKFLVTPMDACSDDKFCCENIGGQCKLKANHAYYAQIQGQMGISGAKWCDFIVYTKKGMSIERIPFNALYWAELENKLITYYYNHFIDFAVKDFSDRLSS